MDEIKSCPFCGGKAELIQNYMPDYGTSWWVECKTCYARIETDTWGEESAIESWNRRVETREDEQ